MTIQDVLSYMANMKPSSVGDDVLVRWISELEGKIYHEVVSWHENGKDVPHGPYNASSDMQTTLLVPSPFDSVYSLYLSAQIDFVNGEYGRFNNSMLMFNTAFSDFANWYNRNNLPIQPCERVW